MESAAGTVDLEINAKIVAMASVLNFTYRSPVDLKMLYEGQDVASGKVSVSHTEIVLMCQKAALRSAMLETSLDPSPLFSAVSKTKDLIHIG